MPADEAPAEAGAAALRRDRFDSARAWAELRRQVELGPRPAGSDALRGLARRLRDALPDGRFETVPGHPGLRNVVGRIPGRTPAIAVAAHYDTKQLPGFVGANDGAAGTAAVMELARALRAADRPEDARELRFLLFDGEEATDDSRPFRDDRPARLERLRQAPRRRARVARSCSTSSPREGHADPARGNSDAAAVGQAARGRAPRRRAGRVPGRHPAARSPTTTCRSSSAACPAIDLIQWPYDCWHRRCDDLAAVERALARPDGRDGARARSYTQTDVTSAPEKLLLAAPRGYCAGVDRAVQTVERALELHGAPVYVRKEIVHNKHVVEELASAGRSSSTS